MLKNVFIAGGVRTPIGLLNGSLSAVSAAQLGSTAVKGALAKSGVQPENVDEVIMGNVVGAGLGQNIARQCSLAAGIGETVPCTTINKVCGSGMRSVIAAAQAIQCGDAELIVAGGTESMTQAPYLLPRARAGYRMGHGQLLDAMIHDGLWDVYNDKHMGTCGDMCADKYKFSRQQMDDYSVESYQRARKSWEDGFFKGFVVPVEIASRKGTEVVDTDEQPARFNEEKMRALRPAFGPKSNITAGNASGISDGAAAMVVVSEEKAKALGIKPDARILGHATAATAPDWFTEAPLHAIKKLSERLALKLADVDRFEINEAFAVVTMLAIRELNLDHARVNAHGGAVALGHPIGMTGARITNTVIRALQRSGGKIGVACLCIGGGEASAIAVERCG
jgi:acetyl-CoA C-acetyltransferase